MSKAIARHHNEWLGLLEASGPFLTVPVLKGAFPQGLEPTPSEIARELRLAYDERQADSSLHARWVRWVLEELLEWDDAVLKGGPSVPQTLSYRVPEYDTTIRPDFVLMDPDDDGRPRVLVQQLPEKLPLDEKPDQDRWAAAPRDRMVELLRVTGVRLGLITNGDTWTLVDAPSQGPSAFATWEAPVWLEERLTLDAFRTLLGAHRFFGVPQDETLEALLAKSADAEEEVTDQLGKQVRAAVETLVDAFSRADRESGGELLRGIGPERLYPAAVTVLMRMVFLLSAEERGLFLLGDPLYDSAYAISTLRGELQEQADRQGPETLERRTAAWHRLLATFRLVHGGVQHEHLRLPAYGGSLFDPNRFPFLEGRAEGESRPERDGTPLPIDDRTVLHILDALQVLRFSTGRGISEARRLSFRALDVEQIGHVYEGLLDHTAIRVSDPAVALKGKEECEIALELIERKDTSDRDAFVEWLKETSGLTKRQTEKVLDHEPVAEERSRLLAACDNDEDLAARIEPYLGLLRTDLRGLPKVFLPESIYVTQALERRQTGTYYTPRSLAEEVVRYTLEPLVYQPGPAEGADREHWQLRTPEELLDLRICDMAMGSGAFLVGACRYLADRLIEAWEIAEDDAEDPVTILGQPTDDITAADAVPRDAPDRLLLARRVVADRCLFGVDKNPMAVEMAKLSMWLITLAKDRPFGFLDHALRCGDSLLGVTDITQIEHLHLDPERGQRIHGQLFDYAGNWQPIVKEAIEKRRRLESFPVVTVQDAEHKAHLHREAEEAMDTLRVIGDIVIAAGLSTESDDALDERLRVVAEDVAASLDPDRSEHDKEVRLQDLGTKSAYWLDTDRVGIEPRRTLHWPLEFPEIFLDRPRGGFDAVIGNPPFKSGQHITSLLGTAYREHLVKQVANRKRGSADLASYFFLRADDIAGKSGQVGLLGTNTIGQGHTREVGLDQLVDRGVTIYRAVRSRPWPGGASLEIAQVWLRTGPWQGEFVLDGEPVRGITSDLDVQSRVSGQPQRLMANAGQSFQGSIVLGMGFTVTPGQAQEMINQDPASVDVLYPYLNGEDLNSHPECVPTRWVINFSDLTLEEAQQYEKCLAVVEQLVKPERVENNYSKHAAKHWWQFERYRSDLYSAIDDFARVIAVALTSNTVMPAFVPADLVYSHSVGIFAYEDDAHFGLLSSAFHLHWTLKKPSTMRTDFRYRLTDCFETFPQPEELGQDVAACGAALDTYRSGVMVDRQEGLTATYKRINDPDEHGWDIEVLRRLHVELDHAVARAYGWEDLELDHGFEETRQGRRYTVGPAVATEICDRLLQLNQERYRKEVLAGWHGDKAKRQMTQPRRIEGQMSLGDGE